MSGNVTVPVLSPFGNSWRECALNASVCRSAKAIT